MASCGDPVGVDRALPRDVQLAGGVTLGEARTHPVEPMSPTSGRCAFRLEHRASGSWTELFPIPGGDGRSGFEAGDVHLADGRVRRHPPSALRSTYRAAWADLRTRLSSHSGNSLDALCHQRDRQRIAAARFWVPLLLGLVLLIVALIYARRSASAGTAIALAGLAAFAVAVHPVLGGESFGTQELQRLWTALRPLSNLLSADHGDARHTAGLFVAYAPAAHVGGSVLALRIYGFVILMLAFSAWVGLRWHRSAGEALTGLSLLLHPVLLKGNLEVGPFAFYTAGMIALYLAVMGEQRLAWKRFGLGLAAQLFLAAINQLGAVLGLIIMLVSLGRTRASLSRRELVLRGLAIAVIALPFLIGIALSFGDESSWRAAAGRTPELAWGSRAFYPLARGLVFSAFPGSLLLVSGLLTCALLYLVGRRHWEGVVWIGLGVITLLGFLLVASRLRVQPYYALYAVPPIILGLAHLIGSLPERTRRIGLGSIVLVVVGLGFLGAAPGLSRRGAAPRPSRLVADAARKNASACPVVLSATNDLVLPLLPALVDLRRQAPPRRLGGGSREVRWTLVTAGLELRTLFGRHQLPSSHRALLRRHLANERSRRCVQYLYDRRFPLPGLYRELVATCRTSVDRGQYRLFRCARTR